MEWKIPLFKIYWTKDDVESVARVIKSGAYWAEGKPVREFEEKIAEYQGAKYCLAFNSGTSALHASLLAYGIKKGDEVIVPSFTFIATANAPLFVGARPVFADIEESTLGLDPEDVEAKITSRTKAVIPVHFGGCPCRIKELRKVARKRDLILIEDAAESMGARVGSERIGTLGNASVLSFCQNKIITTGEGGAIVTDSRKVYEKLKLIRSHGRLETENYFSSIKPFDYIALGYNFRMPSMIAALGISQLEKITPIINARRENAFYLTRNLRRVTGGLSFLEPPKGYYSVYQLYTLLVNKDRDELMRYLAANGIMSKVYFSPVHLTHFYRNKLGYKVKLPVTEKISRKALTLPLFPGLKKSEMDYMVEVIERFFRKK